MLKYLLPLCLIVAPCFAQQQIPTAAETALQINIVLSQWAQTLTQQGRLIDDLQKQLATSQAEVKRLKDKYEAEPNK